MEEPNGGPSRGKRVRRKDESESETSLQDETERKKQKNRDAARKCRQNKLQEVENLKKNNATLEEDNAKLVRKKSDLEVKVRELVGFIKLHMSRGCQLPDDEAIWWKKNEATIMQMLNPNQADFGGGSSPHSHPTGSPNPNMSSGRSAQPMQDRSSSSSMTTSPMTLFSGKPLSAEQFQFQHRSPMGKKSPVQPSPSQSPSLILSCSNSVSDDLIHSAVASTSNFQAPSWRLAHTISPYSQGSPQISSLPASSIPSVVLEEEGTEDRDQTLGYNQTQQFSDILRQTRQSGMEVEPSFESTSFTTVVVDNGRVYNSNSNLGSGGFAYRQDSRSDDLQTVPSSSPDVLYTGGNTSGNMKSITPRKKSVDSTKLNVTGPVMAQALLNIQDAEMSSSLKQQIHSSLSGSTASSSETTAQPTINCELYQPNISRVTYIQPQPDYYHRHGNEPIMEVEIIGEQEQLCSPHPTDSSHSSSTQNSVKLSVLTADGISIDTEFNTNHLKYVEKSGHQFVLNQLPNGKHRVYQVKENLLFDTGYELQLKDSPLPPQPVSTSMSSSVQVVPQDNSTISIDTAIGDGLATATSIQGSSHNASTSCSGNSLPSLNLPSLSFTDLQSEGTDVFSKKPKKNET